MVSLRHADKFSEAIKQALKGHVFLLTCSTTYPSRLDFLSYQPQRCLPFLQYKEANLKNSTPVSFFPEITTKLLKIIC